ncbi:hypothetical protein [Burkholderia sp. MSMB1826]|uniref:hypothetical protein n=1 Tax=Burkholderia sp. MSMB1826 TaxID=1637875 RepID=UPI000757266D|nr:hypothetical protein [Burkholderia sp. MSMB1826]KVL10147.1 hypothetical protein WS95_28930 [Burkholderia sp. MSMB1826]
MTGMPAGARLASSGSRVIAENMACHDRPDADAPAIQVQPNRNAIAPIGPASNTGCPSPRVAIHETHVTRRRDTAYAAEMTTA